MGEERRREPVRTSLALYHHRRLVEAVEFSLMLMRHAVHRWDLKTML